MNTYVTTVRYHVVPLAITYVVLLVCGAGCTGQVSTDPEHDVFRAADTHVSPTCTDNCVWVYYQARIGNCKTDDSHRCAILTKRHHPSTGDTRRTYVRGGFPDSGVPDRGYLGLPLEFDRFAISLDDLCADGLALDFFDMNQGDDDTAFENYRFTCDKQTIQGTFATQTANQAAENYASSWRRPSDITRTTADDAFVWSVDVQIFPSKTNAPYQLILRSADGSNCYEDATHITGKCDLYFKWYDAHWDLSNCSQKDLDETGLLLSVNDHWPINLIPSSCSTQLSNGWNIDRCWNTSRIGDNVENSVVFDTPIATLSDADLNLIYRKGVYEITFEPNDRDSNQLSGADDATRTCKLRIDEHAIALLLSDAGYTTQCGNLNAVTFQLRRGTMQRPSLAKTASP